MALSMLAAVVLALALPDIDAATVNKPSAPGKVQAKKPDRVPRHASRHILVKLEPGTDVPGYFAHAGKHGLTRHGRVYGSDWYTLSLPARANPRAAAAIAGNIPGAVMATPDPIVSIGQIPPRDPIYRDDDDPSNKSCDPIEQSCDPLQLVDQWGMFKVGAEGGWSETTGSSSVVIAVLDSGVDLDHDDLAGNIWINPLETVNGIDDDGNGFVDDIHGADFSGNNPGNPLTDDIASEDANPDIPEGGTWVNDPLAFPYGIRFVGDPAVGDGVDNNFDLIPDIGVFHGTFVAAVAAAMTDNINPSSGEYEGVAGACWNCTIMPVRMINAEGNGYGSDAAAAIRYAADMGADVINLSWGFDTTGLDAAGQAEVTIISEAVNYAVAQGAIIVASAGNSGSSPVSFPASMSNTIAVGSSNWFDRRSDFSTFAAAGEIPDNGIDDDGNGWVDDVVDVVAPGEQIWSGHVYSAFDALQNSLLGDTGVEPGVDAYGNSSGTSFAAPMVSGYIGLLLSRFPGATLDDIRQALRRNALDLQDPEGTGASLAGYDRYSGFGRMRMIVPASLTDPPPPPPPPPPPGPAIALTIDTLDNGQYGHNYGSDAHYTELTATFTADGVTAYQLEVSGHDIDSSGEVSVFLNGNFVANLTPGGNNELNGGDVLPLDPLDMQAGVNTLEFIQNTAGFTWGVTGIGVMTPPPPPPPPPEAELTVDVVDTGSYGNNYGSDEHEVSLFATFTGDGTSTYYLQVTGFDIDYVDELSVRVNGTLTGHLSPGPNLGLNAGDVFTLLPDMLVADVNTIEFRVKTVGWTWGVTNLGILTTMPEPNIVELTVGVPDTGQYGNNYGSNEHPMSLTATFEGDGVSVYELQVTGYDIDYVDEVAVYINGSFLAHLQTGPDNSHNGGDAFTLDPALLLEGENTIEFRQRTAGYTWGVKDLAVVIPAATPPPDPLVISLTVDEVDNGEYGHDYGSNQHEVVVEATFEGDGASTYFLQVTGYDVDYVDEIAVHVNGVFLGYLATGPQSSLNAGDVFTLTPDMLVEDTNSIEFRQRMAGYKWGVTNLGIMSSEPLSPLIVVLTVDEVDTGEYGNNYGSNLHPMVVEARFQWDGSGVHELQVSGYDIDYPDEVAVHVNGSLIGYLSEGPENDLNSGDRFVLDPALLDTGENTIEFRQRTAGYKWGVTDLAVLSQFDTDDDGLPDNTEIAIGTDPLLADTDGDGVTDYEEVNRDGNPDSYDPVLDLDPLQPDSDGDGISDGDEVFAVTDPLDAASTPANGDINNDGRVDVVDVLLVQRHLLDGVALDRLQRLHADVAPQAGDVPAPDGLVNTGDLLVIQRMALGL